MASPQHRLTPKPFNARPEGLWRATPPAIFPPLLGVFGIGLGWRKAHVVMGAPAWIGEMILGAVVLLLIFAGIAYKAKVLRRPGAFLDDLKILPGRAGLAAASACLFLLAATLVPYWVLGAKIILICGLLGHSVVAAFSLFALMTGPLEQRRITPVLQLTYVAFIIACVAAVPLGWVMLAEIIYATILPVAIAIWLLSAVQFARSRVPAPLRPLLAIHLAPLGLFTIVSKLLGYDAAAFGFACLALSLGTVFLFGARYLIAGCFSPLWGAFTFPLAAFANAMLVMAASGSRLFAIVGGVELVLATLFVAWITYKIWLLWMQGKLAKMTNASTI